MIKPIEFSHQACLAGSFYIVIVDGRFNRQIGVLVSSHKVRLGKVIHQEIGTVCATVLKRRSF